MTAESDIHIEQVELDFGEPECITVVLCEDRGKKILLFAEADCELSHQALLDLAIDLEIVDEEVEPVGGALIKYRSLEKKRDSLGLGAIDDEILGCFLEKYESHRKRSN